MVFRRPDQAGRAQSGGSQYDQVFVARVGGFQRVGAADFHIVYSPAVFFQTAAGGVFQFGVGEVAVFDRFGDGLQFAVEARGFGAFGFAQVLVAAGKREAV